jgi:predicted dehydrogenase
MADGTAKQVRVAVVGARGIGRHHANWWRLEGADVCAICGTTPERAAESAAVLNRLFGFAGRIYTDLGELLRRERPDILDVCSPPALHAAHVRAGLTAGVDVLCEKPFVYDPALPAGALLEETDALLRLADERGRRLGLCSQYSVAGARCLALLREHAATGPLTRIEGALASPAKGRPVDPLATWIDLGPHLLAAVQAAAPDALPGLRALATTFTGHHARCTFHLTRPGQPPLACDLHAYRTEGDGPAHVRRLVLNGTGFDIEGETDAAGIFRARIVTPHGEFREDDLMRQLIRATLAGRPPMPPPVIRRNQEWLLAVASTAAAG